MFAVNVSGYLDHAFRDFRRDIPGKGFALQQGKQVGARRNQVEVAQADQLQFQFDAQSERFRLFEDL
ncbi:hypothetical protein D9M68_748170 [compost metagenome]